MTSVNWVVINITYTDADIANVQENTLTLYRFNGTDWVLSNGTSTLVAVSNIITANLTQFSPFAPFGQEQEAPPAAVVGGGGGGSSYYNVEPTNLDIVEKITKTLRKLDFLDFTRKTQRHRLTLLQSTL